MKKLLVSILAITGMVACVNEQVVVQQGATPMEFAGAFVENATRAEDPSITTGTLSAFDVWAWVYDESGNTVENSKAINAGTETNNNIGRHA